MKDQLLAIMEILDSSKTDRSSGARNRSIKRMIIRYRWESGEERRREDRTHASVDGRRMTRDRTSGPLHLTIGCCR
jgi:hypothetical protein